MTVWKDRKYKYVTISEKERLALNFACETLLTINSYMAKESYVLLENLLDRSKHTNLSASKTKGV
jgi:hypothetical protein